jgi:hypothetical protein
MSGTAATQRYYSCTLHLLGRGDRTIIDRGKEAISSDISVVFPTSSVSSVVYRHPYPRRAIVFPNCGSLSRTSDIEIGGRKVPPPAFVSAYFEEQPSSDRLPWPDKPWKIGGLDQRNEVATVSLYVSPVAFEQFWEMVDAPENERSDVEIRGQVIPSGGGETYEFILNIEIYEINLKPLSRPGSRHLVVQELQRRWPVITKIQRDVGLLVWMVAALLVTELIRWLWR